MLHRANGVSICGPCTCPRSKSSCAWSSQHWARKSAQTLLPAGRARLLQDLPPLHCRHSAAFNGLLLDWSQPVTLWLNPPWHLLPQVLEKLRVSRARGILVYPYWPLQPWFQEVQRLSALHFSLPPPRHCVRSHHPGLVEPFVNREVRLRAVVFDCA